MASLKFMSAMHPSKIDYSTLMVLAQNTLCYWHGSQADNICAEWEDAIEDYLRENSQSRAAVTPVKQEPYEARDAKQLRNGSAKVEATSEQEMTEMRHALGEVQAELEKSEARCSALLAKNSKLDRQQEEERASNARNIDLLRQNSRSIESVTQQLTNFQTWAKAQEEQKVEAAEQLKKRLAEKADEADKLRGQLAGRNANFEKNVAASSKEISRLEARVKELEALNRKYADDREEDARQIARLREQDRKVEVLTKQMDTMEKSRSQLAGRNAEFEKNISASSKETSRLEARVRELEALNRQYADGREEDATQISRLGEQDRKVEVLTKQMDAVSRELEEREVGCFYLFIYLE